MDTATLHTPGRMTFREDGDANHYSMMDDTGRWWLAMLHNGEAPSARQVANMRRLAACWNACDMIPTEALEEISANGGFIWRLAVGASATATAAVDDAPDAHGWRPSYGVQADAEGWGIFNDGEIQRDDEADVFAGDDEAIAFVRRRAIEGSHLHAAALLRCGLSTTEQPAPVVVVEMDGGLINVVRSSVPVRVILLDADTEGGDKSVIAEIEGEAVYMHDFSVSREEIEPARCIDTARQVDEARAAQDEPAARNTWRTVPHGSAHVLSNDQGADIGHAYLAPSGKWVGDPWGRATQYFDGPTAEADARAWVEKAFA